MIKYHALVLCNYSNNYWGYSSVTVWAMDPEEAAETVKEVILERWANVESFELIQLGKTKIKLEKYIMKVDITFRTPPYRRVKEITIAAPDSGKAADCVDKILDAWNNVTGWLIFGFSVKESGK